jgi:hypothetical protein
VESPPSAPTLPIRATGDSDTLILEHSASISAPFGTFRAECTSVGKGRVTVESDEGLLFASEVEPNIPVKMAVQANINSRREVVALKISFRPRHGTCVLEMRNLSFDSIEEKA